jgi:hypothetical protein
MTEFPMKLAAVAIVLAGSVALTSFAQAQEGQGKKGPVERFDADKDGKITLEEIMQKTAKRFARIDANGDGKITEDELRQKIKKNLEKRSKRMISGSTRMTMA